MRSASPVPAADDPTGSLISRACSVPRVRSKASVKCFTIKLGRMAMMCNALCRYDLRTGRLGEKEFDNP